MKLSAITFVAAFFALATQPTIAKDWSASTDGTSSAYVQHTSSFAPSYINEGESTATEIGQLTPQQPVVDRAETVRIELNSYSNYVDDWDGDGAAAPNKSHVTDAIAFLDKIPSGYPLPKTMLSASGAIGLYWDHPALFADIAFEGGNAFSFFARDKRTKDEAFAENVALTDLNPAWFAEHLKNLREA
ncbi:hypothetical protein CIC12_03860 [Burkholderia sp. SG-MS1]|uniref:hypothetical protein n=1 Tax=Paraburkholderia sp. SG-MS1 TaxID=2023741 RepID=UPI001447FA70|nr:hypothetical protein [Paraburkholderia sp. SG-MS1]NKJ45890.1 hypothetical protein [Paraburkholderia sp. SG-MS1]